MLSRQWKALTFTLFIGFPLAHCATFNNDRSTADTVVVNKEMAFEENLVRQQVTSYAKQYLGINYKYAGRSPKGFDCSGFTHFVMNHFNVAVSPCSRNQVGQGRKIELPKVRPGDLIFFRRPKSKYIFHVAMVVSNDKSGVHIIHSTSRGVVIDNLNESKYWKPKAYAARDVVSGSSFKLRDIDPQSELPLQGHPLPDFHLNMLVYFI
ncbi:MAG: NlpC/P60 family protein [Saprospiraceae bacterium]|nr:NlpC/P60 family protein [Saprospiraceae bacterium]MDZ4705426.1 NlpC/P60 family protein [Saprospiraceae bacterium]